MKDYEKKYKEALERAKKYKLKEDLIITQDIFPELKESRDEKIRKALIRYFTLSDEHAYNEACGVSYRDIVAWLEKQGEQRLPIEKLPSEMKSIGESLGFTTQEVCDRYNQMVTDLIMADDDKIEQNHAWNEEDEKLVKNLISTLSNLYARNLIEKETKEKYTNWLKSLRPQNTWKPDGDQLDALYDMIRSFKKESSYTNRDDIANIVDTLLKQLEAL